MVVLMVGGDVGEPGSAQVAHPAGLHLVVTVLVYQELGQLVETLPALEAPEAGGVLQSLVQSSVSVKPGEG